MRSARSTRSIPNGDFKYGVTGIPYYKGGAQLCHTDSWHFGISPQSKHIDISAALVKFLTGPVGAKIWYDANRQLPARIELLNTLPEYSEPPQQLFADGLNTSACHASRPRLHRVPAGVRRADAEHLARPGVEVDPLVKDASRRSNSRGQVQGLGRVESG